MLCAYIDHIHKLCKFICSFFLLWHQRRKKGTFHKVKPFCTFRAELSTAKEGKKKKQQKFSALPNGITLTEWMFIPFASQTKSLSAAKDNAAHLLLPLLGEGWDGEL